MDGIEQGRRHEFIRAPVPAALQAKGEEMFGVIRRNHSGVDIRVASLEPVRVRSSPLSVDIDLNYVGALQREAMLADRPKVEQAAQTVFSREGFITKRVPTEHAGGKWRLSYQSYTGQSGNLEVDLNFMLRQPLLQWKALNVKRHKGLA
jgi:hypothetical protein